MATTHPDEFPSMALVQLIETSEMQALQSCVTAAERSGWALPIAGGMALYRRRGSPLNKVVGLGFNDSNEEIPTSLERVEQAYATEQEPVQVELSTYAPPELTNLLVARGYHFCGFECVLGRSLIAPATTLSPGALITAPIPVRILTRSETPIWVDVLTQGFSTLHEGETAAEHDDFSQNALRAVFMDMAAVPTMQHWLAEIDGLPAGGATMSTRNRIAQLFGAATLPPFRRRGVQSRLLQARLEHAAAADCTLAVITTQPGSASQRNAQRCGFVPLYARAIWRR